MSKPKLNRAFARIEIPIPPDDKQALQKWCQVNGMTMAEVFRSEVSHLIKEGYKLD
jgi:hypothetical protein